MNSTTKSCSTYLSANLLHRGHCVSRTPLPSARSSAFEYSVYSVFTGYRHSMHMGIALLEGREEGAQERARVQAGGL
jgi:hypothetical protein